jgi:hypothetical protein
LVAGWEEVSFGKYVRHLALEQGIPLTRENLQELGVQELTVQGVQPFLRNAIGFNKPNGFIHVYESIRHLSILSAIQLTYKKTTLVYLDLDEKVRYHRYLGRQRDLDSARAFDDFLVLGKHEVERDVLKMRELADLIVDASLSTEEIAATIQVFVSTK